MKKYLYLLLITLVTYLAVSFVSWDIRITEWNGFARFVFILIVGSTAFTVLFTDQPNMPDNFENF